VYLRVYQGVYPEVYQGVYPQAVWWSRGEPGTGAEELASGAGATEGVGAAAGVPPGQRGGERGGSRGEEGGLGALADEELAFQNLLEFDEGKYYLN